MLYSAESYGKTLFGGTKIINIYEKTLLFMTVSDTRNY